MRTPILIVTLDTREVDVYDTLKEAAQSIECYDIDEYAVFDADGCRVRIVGEKPTGFWSVLRPVELVPTDERDPEALRSALLRCLQMLGDAAPESASLDELIQQLLAHNNRYEQDHRERWGALKFILQLALIIFGLMISNVTYADYSFGRLMVVLGWMLQVVGAVWLLSSRFRKRNPRR